MQIFVPNLTGPRASPIGVDFGTDTLRLAQVQYAGDVYRMHAAAEASVPVEIRFDLAARLAFFTRTIRDLLVQGNFAGRAAMIALPAAYTHIAQLRLPASNDEQIKAALPAAMAHRVPIELDDMLLRHLAAQNESDPSHVEVAVFAASRNFVGQLIAAAGKARLDVVGMNTQAAAIIDCFSRVFRRKSDATNRTAYIDLGARATRIIIARGSQIQFARTFDLGGDSLNLAVASAMKIDLNHARRLRLRICHAQAISERMEKSLIYSPLPTSDDEIISSAKEIDNACAEVASRIADEIGAARREYESIFNGAKIDRIIFVGGEAQHRSLCRQIAVRLNIESHIGDPLSRMDTKSANPAAIDRRLMQPVWSAAIGLSVGPVANFKAEKAA